MTADTHGAGAADDTSAVAVIGMAGRFPGARSVTELWRNLLAGKESLTRLSTAELESEGVPAALHGDPDYVPVRGLLEAPCDFDAGLFGYSPKEAQLTDPQQRLLLESAWEALDDAGYGGTRTSTGVFVGTSFNSYLLHHIVNEPSARDDIDFLQLVLGNDKDHAATRIAYKLDLHGPAVTVQTACSTSLVAVHQACQALLGGDCDIALAGGASVQLPQRTGYLYSPNGIFSPDGHCRPFDQDAHGTVVGAGAALVVLKRADRALADGDTIHALIRGSAVNNDGARKAGYTAPSIQGQREVILSALRAARVDPSSIGYVEAHGTGTELGDGIEISALTEAYRQYTAETGFCGIGSVKANLGHLDAAAGVTGLIKAVLAVREGQVPPSINCTTPNPEIPWAETPFFVETHARTWEAAPRRAAVSAFGMGGTNAHVIVEQPPSWPVSDTPEKGGPAELVVVSAASRGAAHELSAAISQHLAEERGPRLSDAAFTLQMGRKHLRWRVAVAASDPVECSRRLSEAQPQEATRPPTVAFLFPGQGSQRAGMAKDLYAYCGAFSSALDECVQLLYKETALDLLPLLLEEGAAFDAVLRRTSAAQPALFAVEYALARQLEHWGVWPKVMLGHSIGEYTAACLSGAITLPDAMRLVTARGRIMEAAPSGAMLSVLAEQDSVAALLPADLSIAAVNAPEATVVAGPEGAVERFAVLLAERSIPAKRLRVSHAFHSAAMDAALPAFHRVASAVSYGKARTKVVSNLSGEPVQGFSADYLTEHLRQPVQFSRGVATVMRMPNPVFVEVGPGRTLSSFVLAQNRDGAVRTCSPMAANGSADAYETLLTTVGELWCSGVNVDWHSIRTGRRTALPPYPFQRGSYQLGSATPRLGGVVPEAAAPASTESDIASQLRELWRRLLGAVEVRPNDDFFALGGNSLLAVRLVALLGKNLGVTINLDDVLASPGFQGQLELVRRRRSSV
ncbi:beta-ketoacyl synthase N-terminal-like domain-containing protein [Kitasatospora cineracea]